MRRLGQLADGQIGFAQRLGGLLGCFAQLRKGFALVAWPADNIVATQVVRRIPL